MVRGREFSKKRLIFMVKKKMRRGLYFELSKQIYRKRRVGHHLTSLQHIFMILGKGVK